MGDGAEPIDQHADLTADLTRELGQLAGQLLAQEAFGREPAAAEALEPLQLARLQAMGVAFDADSGFLAGSRPRVRA